MGTNSFTRSNYETDRGWPDREQFPYNFVNQHVQSVIQKDLNQSKNLLIITGYASLDRIIDFLAARYQRFVTSSSEDFGLTQILLGHEPYPTKSQEFRLPSYQFSREIEAYWLERRISILKCAKVIAAIKFLNQRDVFVKIGNDKPIHAKIYKCDRSITIGSSNFTDSGLLWQIEANVRFDNQKKTDRNRIFEAITLSERIWELGCDYNEELIKLLERLLSKVDWQYALAIACMELLDGDWAKRYRIANYLDDKPVLWPSQEKGIAQAIWVLENVGSVLIADATGSGKTRMGAHLIKTVMNGIWATGRMRKGSPVMICPPDAVKEAWEREFRECDYSLQTNSYGILGRSDSRKHPDLISVIRRGQVLAIDEAHKFLNRQSKQTRALFNNMADHILLFTATPINRGAKDLLAIVDLLGADNFEDEVLEVLKPLWTKRKNVDEKLSYNDKRKLRNAIQKFTVRRTKTMLNQLIEEEPERYINRNNQQCRYPRNISKTYNCGETESDRDLARTIREQADNLRGLSYLRNPIKLPESLRDSGVTETEYLQWRLTSAKLLAVYQIMACLRSSRAALFEHIYGTKRAQEKFEIPDKIKNQPTGNLIKTLQKIAGKRPVESQQVELPDWLGVPSKHKQACETEIEVYNRIANLTEKISNSREETKTDILLDLRKKHQLVLAFDSRLITLHDIGQRLKQRGYKAIVATGNNETNRRSVNDRFQLGSQASGIALCSDAMSEGVNLQQASAVVLLDMPSVIRLAEQRIGRVERMDSPHDMIEVYWPKDSDEFALRSSERKFLDRHHLVDDLLGSNLQLPEELSLEYEVESRDAVVKLDEDIDEVQQTDVAVKPKKDELRDVFEPVRSLVEGNAAIVEREIYNRLRRNQAIEVSVVSVVEAKKTWAFFAIAGTDWGAPRWVYLDSPKAEPITDLEQISQKLREKLVPPVTDIPIERADPLLEQFLNRLKQTEKLLLPKKKQRALEQMESVLKTYKKKANQWGDIEREQDITRLLDRINIDFEANTVDLSLLAESWLDLIRPQWLKHLQKRRRIQPLQLKDIRNELIENPITIEKLREALTIPQVKPLDERIVAAIVGVA